MTSYTHWIQQLAQILPKETRPWVFTALKTEPFVWFSLQDPAFLTKAVEFLGAEAKDWSPGMLALLSLSLPARPQWYQKEPLAGLDSELRQQVAKTFESLTKGEALFNTDTPDDHQQPSWFSNVALPKAGLLALALRERLRLLGSWSGLRQDLEGLPDFHPSIWKAPLACLFGLVADPVGLLLELTSPEASYEMQSLAIHSLLANPLPESDRTQIFQKLFQATEPAIQHSLLGILMHKKPALGVELAGWQADQPFNNPDKLLNLPGNDFLEQLLILSHQAELNRSAKKYGLSLRLVEQAINLTSRLRVDFSARWAAIASNCLDISQNQIPISQVDVIAAWKLTCELDQANPESGNLSTYHLESSRTLIQAGEQKEIHSWLALWEQANHQFTQPVPVDIQAALIKYLWETKDFVRGRDIACQLINSLQTSGEANRINEVWLDNLYGSREESRLDILSGLAPTLLELGLYRQCIWTSLEILTERPNEVTFLQLLGSAYRCNNQIEAASAPLELASILEPDRLEIRREYATCLEAIGNYTAAMDQWSFVVEHPQDAPDNKMISIEDALSLASCAIAAGKDELAVELCQKTLADDISNWRAYTLLGQALGVVESPQAGLASLMIASQLAPDQPEPWLKTAALYQQTGQNQEAILALQAASQAAPHSASIHLALGRALLEENSLTSAAESLNQAYKLSQLTNDNYVSPSAQLIFIQSANYLGQALRRLGHINDSRQTLEPAYQLIKDGPQDAYPDLRYTYAKTLLALGETKDALPILAQVVSAQPVEEQPYIDYAATILTEGIEFHEAVRVLKQVLSNHPNNPEALALLADSLAGCYLYPEAKQAYLAAMETNLVQEKTWQERIFYGLGRTAFAMNEVDTAIAALQDASQVNPRNPKIQRHLADACWAARLDYDAWVAAQNALQLEPTNPDILGWFADHTVELYKTQWEVSPVSRKMIDTSPGQPGAFIHPPHILSEALNALHQVFPKFIDQADMVVRLGQLYALSGQNSKACEQLRLVSHCSNPSANALQQAGHWLYKLDDNNAAIQAFEHAQNICKQNHTKEPIELLKHLCQAYLSDDQFQAAKQILMHAVKVSPDDVELYLTLALIEHANGQYEKVLQILTQGLENCPDEGDQTTLHFLAARLLQIQGHNGPALKHTDSILINNKHAVTAGKNINLYEVRSLAVQLSRALLDNQRAYGYLSGLPVLVDSTILADILTNEFVSRSALECYCAFSELALENNDAGVAEANYANAEKILQAMQSQDKRHSLREMKTSHPRVAAIQARLLYRQRNYNGAVQVFNETHQMVGMTDLLAKPQAAPAHVKPVWEQSIQASLDQNTLAITSQDLLGLVNAALDLCQFEQVASLAYKLKIAFPAAPIVGLTYIRCNIQQAEMMNLCQDLGIIQHTPYQTMALNELQAAFHASIDHTEKALWLASEALGPIILNTPKVEELPGYKVIQGWRYRGLWALYTESSNGKQPAEIFNARWDNVFTPTGDEVAARLASIRHWITNQPDKQMHRTAILNEIHSTDAFQLCPTVMIQKAMLLEFVYPEEALLTAHNLVRFAEEAKDQTLQAQSQALLAILAYHLNEQETALTAIQAALALWPDEPRWQAIASQIYLSQNAYQNNEKATLAAIKHLEEAIRLEPHLAQHYLDLIKLLPQTARQEPANLNRIVRTLEKAVHYAPEQPAAWLVLAKAYFQSHTPGNLDQALVCIDKVDELALEPASEELKQDAILLRADISLLQKDPKEAFRLGSLIRQELPESSQALMIQVCALEAMDRKTEALKELEKSAQTGALPKELRIKQAALMGQCIDKKLEIAALNDLTRQNPADLDILTALTRSLMADGQIDNAIQAAQSALQIGPTTQNLEKYARMHHLLGNLLTQIGQLDQGIHHLSQAIMYLPEFVEAYLDLGSAYQKQRQHLKAQKTYQQAILAVQYDYRPYVQAALCLKEGKDYPGAENLLRRAAELAPHDVSIRKQLAAIVAINLVHNPHPVQTY